jgi:hypothetical protein
MVLTAVPPFLVDPEGNIEFHPKGEYNLNMRLSEHLADYFSPTLVNVVGAI